MIVVICTAQNYLGFNRGQVGYEGWLNTGLGRAKLGVFYAISRSMIFYPENVGEHY